MGLPSKFRSSASTFYLLETGRTLSFDKKGSIFFLVEHVFLLKKADLTLLFYTTTPRHIWDIYHPTPTPPPPPPPNCQKLL